jgi:hypothetical protein
MMDHDNDHDDDNANRILDARNTRRLWSHDPLEEEDNPTTTHWSDWKIIITTTYFKEDDVAGLQKLVSF